MSSKKTWSLSSVPRHGDPSVYPCGATKIVVFPVSRGWSRLYPAVLTAVPLPPIVYITGLERSGTTLLHNLLALHPQARAEDAPAPLHQHPDEVPAEDEEEDEEEGEVEDGEAVEERRGQEVRLEVAALAQQQLGQKEDDQQQKQRVAGEV